MIQKVENRSLGKYRDSCQGMPRRPDVEGEDSCKPTNPARYRGSCSSLSAPPATAHKRCHGHFKHRYSRSDSSDNQKEKEPERREEPTRDLRERQWQRDKQQSGSAGRIEPLSEDYREDCKPGSE